MFISKQEKKQMQESITYLLGETSKLMSDVLFLRAKVKVLEGQKQEQKRAYKSGWTQEQRNAQSDRMKTVWANKKETRA